MPWTEFREIPAVVGAKLVASGESSTAEELEGSIDNLRLVSAEASTRFVSIGGGVNVAGTSLLDCASVVFDGC